VFQQNRSDNVDCQHGARLAAFWNAHLWLGFANIWLAPIASISAFRSEKERKNYEGETSDDGEVRK
jgi:hypothetical protein